MSWLQAHAISPALAQACGVKGTPNGPIEFKYRSQPTITRTRLPDGRTIQPKGEPLRLYWPVGGWGSKCVLLCEGESDTLAAATVLCDERGEPRDGLPEVLAGLCPVGLPGVGMPSERVGALLRGYGAEQVFVCLDGDLPGQTAAQRLVESLEFQGISAYLVPLSPAKDLSDCLAAIERATASGNPKQDWLAHLLADAESAKDSVAA